ncbi:MAG: DNA cytosine methyltransferase [Paludibacteraceae bacterium]
MKRLLYIDLFCGAGGTSTGVERARLHGEKCARVIACVNHDKNAIASHAANHPNALHFTEDIRTLDLTELTAHVRIARDKDKDALIVLWASLECTNFSKAKGGQPRNADSRTLAEHLFRYIDTLQPDYIYIENVEEFMCWGDLDENGKPISRDEGKHYMRWVSNVCKRGFDFDHRLLNSANYGARTSRTRFFGIFARHGLPIVFPAATHCKGGSKPDMFGNGLRPWNAVRDVLELDNEGESIFARKTPLVERTLERIYAGLIKFVAGGNNDFLSRYNSVRPIETAMSIDEPCGVVTTENRFAKVHCQFLSKQFSGHPDSKNVNIDEPSGAITCKDHHALVSAKFIDAYYGKGHEHSLDLPAPVIRTVGHLALVSSSFIDMQYGNGTPASIDAPAMTVSTNPKLNLVSVKPWVMNTSFSNVGSSIDEPSQTITANRKWHYLIKPQLACQGEDMYIVVYETDSPAMRRIKEFMAIYGIADIKMRMLNIGELKRIMGFGSDYILIGTQTEQKKYIGNAVEVNMSRVLCEALAKTLNEKQ